MIANVKARYSNGALVPLEPLELEEDVEVVVSVEEIFPPRKALPELKAVTGAWEGTHDPEELLRNIYSDRLVNSRPEPKI